YCRQRHQLGPARQIQRGCLHATSPNLRAVSAAVSSEPTSADSPWAAATPRLTVALMFIAEQESVPLTAGPDPFRDRHSVLQFTVGCDDHKLLTAAAALANRRIKGATSCAALATKSFVPHRVSVSIIDELENCLHSPSRRPGLCSPPGSALLHAFRSACLLGDPRR